MTNKRQTHIHRREKRKKKTAEEFTPAWLINQMLDKLSEYSGDSVWQEDKTFCDPACGNGNMLVEILRRKLQNGHNPVRAMESIYGVDIIPENIRECRLRLLKLVSQMNPNDWQDIEVRRGCIVALFMNIACPRKSKCPKGSLDPNFAFLGRLKKPEWVDEWLKNIGDSLRWVDADKGFTGNTIVLNCLAARDQAALDSDDSPIS